MKSCHIMSYNVGYEYDIVYDEKIIKPLKLFGNDRF